MRMTMYRRGHAELTSDVQNHLELGMSPEQYERWKDFTRRMVPIAVSARKRSPSRADVLANIEFFFECRMDPDEEWRRVQDWDSTEPSVDFPHSNFNVSDHIKDLAEHFIPGYWGIDSDLGYERASERYLSPVQACIRSGLDVAVAPSAGVAGFRIGDLRRMYPEGVPEWVKTYCQPEVSHCKVSSFDEVPDTEHVWL